MKIHGFCLILAILFGGFTSAISQVAFAPVTSYSAPSTFPPSPHIVYPRAVTAADVNGDGLPDLIVADAGQNQVLILTNYGNGTFHIGQNNVKVGAFPTAVVATDVNNDGKIDIICTDENANSLTVMTNNGIGNFTISQTLQTGPGPTWVIAADINKDGAPDLISANWLSPSPSLSVFTNNGSGIFGSAATYFIPGTIGADSVAAADINNDGNIDLIAAGPGGFTVLTNNGNGFFVTNYTVLVSNELRSIQAVDVNGDGKPDVVAVSYSNSVVVWTNNGSGILGSNATYTVASYPYWVVSSDMNGDGKPDLICASIAAVSVLTNDGSGNFALAASPQVGGAVEPALAAADLNNDGHMDLISVTNNNFPSGGIGGLSVLISVPVLKSSVIDSGVNLSWPSSWTNWVLLQNSNLTTTNWTISDNVFDDGTNKQMTLGPSPPENLFFRLQHP
jgi:hypothetical protein